MASPWAGGGAAALHAHAPVAQAALDGLVTTWPEGLHEVDLATVRAVAAEGLGLTPLRRPPTGPRAVPALPQAEVMAFAEQLAVDVSELTAEQRAGWLEVVGPDEYDATLAVFVAEQVPRARAALESLFGPDVWHDVVPTRTGHARLVLEELVREVMLLEEVDPVTTELVRLRVARHHGARSAMSMRSLAALRAGADAATFAAVDHYRDSGLRPDQQAALALADGIVWTPADLRPRDLADVRARLSPAQAVEVVLDVVACSVVKIDLALGRDQSEEPGLRLFEVDPSGSRVFP